MTDFPKTPEIIPSLFAADPLHYCEALKAVERFGCRRIHLDIMDGHFVPNISFGTNVVAAVAKDGIQLIAKARVTVRTNIKQLAKFNSAEEIASRVIDMAKNFNPSNK